MLFDFGVAERFPLRLPEHQELADRYARIAQQSLHDIFVHADGRTEHAGANKRNMRELEQPLDGSILTQRSMEYGKDDVDAAEGRARGGLHYGSSRIAGQHGGGVLPTIELDL